MTLTLQLGQSAKFDLSDAATADSGSLSWTASPLNSATLTNSFDNATSPAPPHTNGLTFTTDAQTKPGIYDYAVFVTSSVTGLSSPATTIHIRVLLPIVISGMTPSRSTASTHRNMLTIRPM
ncbi:MAG: hypothetical protein NVSMB64_29620 [Candidatus Velthaea sp.]